MDLFNGIINALSLSNLWYCFVGCVLGTLVGVLPGLGPASALSILLPITMFLDPLGSVIMLAEAGVLVGKRYGFWTDPSGIGDRFAGAIYGGTGVVQDANIITCGVCPQTATSQSQHDCNVELIQAFITALTTKK